MSPNNKSSLIYTVIPVNRINLDGEPYTYIELRTAGLQILSVSVSFKSTEKVLKSENHRIFRLILKDQNLL